MKRALIIYLLALSLVLCGCADSNENNGELITELEGAISSVNSESRVSGSYMIEITVRGVTLYYAKGNIAFDREEKCAYNDFSQTYMGSSAVAQNYYSGGKLVSVEKSGVNSFDRAPEEIMGKFPYSKLLELPEGVSGVAEKSSSVGRTVELTRNDTKAICDSVVGESLYTLASVIKKPQTDKTQYGDTKCTYTLKDGKINGCRYEFSVTLFDTPAYVPGYSVPESEYTLELNVVAKVNYDEFGSDVKIAEFSQDENKES